jgi:hypothetical protein
MLGVDAMDVPPLGLVRKIDVDSLAGKVEKFLLDGSELSYVDSFSVDAVFLITHNRLDLVAKIAYLLGGNCSYTNKLYDSHIKIFTLGRYVEKGAELKNTADKFADEFEGIYRSLVSKEFDVNISYVPICVDGSLLNGAHRVSACFVSKRIVDVVVLDYPPFDYGYEFFQKRGMAKDQIEYLVTRFSEFANDVYVALLWPAYSLLDVDCMSYFPKVIYDREVKLTFQGLHNLMVQAYSGEHWLGSCDDGFSGAKGKARKCFGGQGVLRVIVFQSSSIDDVVSIKKTIRERCGIGKSSIHITDSKAEALNLCQLLLNDNSRHFLNYGNPYKYRDIFDRVCSFKSDVVNSGCDLDGIVIDGGAVLSVYGLRESRDFDYISLLELVLNSPGVDCHDSQLKYYDVDKEDLIGDPNYFFYFNGLKFMSLEKVRGMKVARAGGKDILDVRLIDSNVYFKTKGSLPSCVRQVYQVIKFKVSILEGLLADFLMKFPFYNDVRRVYRRFFRK